MNIAIILHPSIILDTDVHAGIERVVLQEAEGLAKRGCQAVIYAAKVRGHQKNIRRLWDLGWQNRFLQVFYYLFAGLRSFKADVIHGHYAPLIALLYPRRALVHFHGLAISELPLYRLNWARKRYHRANYVFISRWVRDEFQNKYKDMPDGKMHVLYNGVDVDKIKPAGKGRDDKVGVAFYGRWLEKKGIFDVLTAARMLEKRGRSDFRIFLGGSSGLAMESGDDSVDRKVREMADGLTSVEFVGEIKHDDLPAYLAGNSLGLMPSIFREPLGLVALEMMAAGVPVIAYDLGGPKEAIVNGKTGFLVENKRPDILAEKIEWFLDNRQALAAMGQSARRHMEVNFGLVAHMEGLMKIYKQVSEYK